MSATAGIFEPPKDVKARIVRFQDEFGQEHFGLPEDSFRARVLERHEATGRMQATDRSIAVMEVLPPLDPVAIYGVGLNYRDHAAETGKEVPRSPSESAFSTPCYSDAPYHNTQPETRAMTMCSSLHEGSGQCHWTPYSYRYSKSVPGHRRGGLRGRAGGRHWARCKECV